MQETVSSTKTIPITTNNSSCLVRIAKAPNVAPNDNEPVSPIAQDGV